MTALVLEDLTVRFGGVAALEKVSVAVAGGSAVGIVGPNGAGKTTLLNAASGFVRPTRGRIRVGDLDQTRWGPARRARSGIGRAFQTPNLVSDLSVLDNVAVAAMNRAPASRLPKAPRDLLALVGLRHCANADAGALTLTERRLADLARALAVGPTVLLLDEPATGLREHDVVELITVLDRLRWEFDLAIVVVSHDMQLVYGACSRVVVLVDGSVLVEGSPEEVLRSETVVTAYFGAGTST